MDGLTQERAEELLTAIRSVRALVVGDVMLDRYVQGEVDRISPEAPVPVVHVDAEWAGAGGAANVALTLGTLGARCSLVGCVGTDEAGDRLRALLADREIETRGLLGLPGRPTTVKTRVVSRGQQIVRVDREVDAEVDDAVAERLVDELRARLADADVIIVADYDKGVMTRRVARSVIETATSASVPVVVDPKRRRFFDYCGAAVMKPNARELDAALGEPCRPTDRTWMSEARARLGCGCLLVTLGARGMALDDAHTGHRVVPALAREVFDVSGAGDTVSAAVAGALACGATAPEAAWLANHAAAIEVSSSGVAVVGADDIRQSVRANAPSPT